VVCRDVLQPGPRELVGVASGNISEGGERDPTGSVWVSQSAEQKERYRLDRGGTGREVAAAGGADVDANAGLEAIHIAARDGDAEAVRAFVAAGQGGNGAADINQTDHREGRTALFFACERGHINIVENLIDAGANTAIASWNRVSPLGIALRNVRVDVATLLLGNQQERTSIDLSRNDIGATGAQALATALERNSFITSIDFTDNSIRASGAQALATALERNSSITSIDLWSNFIGTAGTQVIATAGRSRDSLVIRI